MPNSDSTLIHFYTKISICANIKNFPFIVWGQLAGECKVILPALCSLKTRDIANGSHDSVLQYYTGLRCIL